jgi:gamma-glutamyltranspeptidase / glutathione hydrolase
VSDTISVRRADWVLSGPPSTLLCWASLVLQLQPAQGLPTQDFLTPRVSGKRGAVASESSICSNIGADIVGIGGTAADAMVATTLCVGVIGMYHSGIGGGGFMLVRDEKGRYEVIDYRETAPAASDRDMYKDNGNASTVGGLSVGVPGELRGLEYLHKTYGVSFPLVCGGDDVVFGTDGTQRLPWATVVMPAVRVARDGFSVNEDLVRYMDAVGGNTSFLVIDPVWATDFAPNGG